MSESDSDVSAALNAYEYLHNTGPLFSAVVRVVESDPEQGDAALGRAVRTALPSTIPRAWDFLADEDIGELARGAYQKTLPASREQSVVILGPEDGPCRWCGEGEVQMDRLSRGGELKKKEVAVYDCGAGTADTAGYTVRAGVHLSGTCSNSTCKARYEYGFTHKDRRLFCTDDLLDKPYLKVSSDSYISRTLLLSFQSLQLRSVVTL